MGQAKNRKAEIEQLKKTGSKKDMWKELRPLYVDLCRELQKEYLEELCACGDDTKAAIKIMESGENIKKASMAGYYVARQGIATVEQIKDAAWEGYNGLLEACCVERNIQMMLGLPQSEINPDDFIITGPDAMEKAKERGWF